MEEKKKKPRFIDYSFAEEYYIHYNSQYEVDYQRIKEEFSQFKSDDDKDFTITIAAFIALIAYAIL